MTVAHQASQVSPQITAGLHVAEVSERTAGLVQLPAAQWSAADLTGFIREEIARLHGEQLPCPEEDQILDGFAGRFGADGVVIARRAFEDHQGIWRWAPVTVRRFGPGQDDFFALALLREANGT